MAPLLPSASQDGEGDTSAATMEDYGTTTEPSTTNDELEGETSLDMSTDTADDETHSLAAFTAAGASTLISNASSRSNASHYFKPTHTPSDSLDYSVTSSTNSIRNALENHEISTSSYMGSIGRSLGAQQAFPSSMFPGQKLISPVSEQRETIQVQNFEQGRRDLSSPTHRPYPSYYYYSMSSYNTDSSDGSNGNSNQRELTLPLSYQRTASVSKNVYQKRQPAFCPDVEQDVQIEIDDGSWFSAWKKCWRCFFHPRVLVTLLVCGVIVFNLLRLGGHHHHNKYLRNTGRISSADYIKVETIGGRNNGSINSSSMVSVPKNP